MDFKVLLDYVAFKVAWYYGSYQVHDYIRQLVMYLKTRYLAGQHCARFKFSGT